MQQKPRGFHQISSHRYSHLEMPATWVCLLTPPTAPALQAPIRDWNYIWAQSAQASAAARAQDTSTNPHSWPPLLCAHSVSHSVYVHPMACQLSLTSAAMCIPRERLWSHRGRVSPPACGPRSGPALCPSLHHCAYLPSVPTAIYQYAPAGTSLGATVQPRKNMPTARAPADAPIYVACLPSPPPTTICSTISSCHYIGTCSWPQ